MLRITLRQLRVFESVARHLSFSRAAQEMFLSQPAVSMQIKQLEENIGLPLFEQMGKRIHLTEAGRELFHYSKTIGAQLAEAEDVLDKLKGLEHGKLNVTVVSTANYFAPQLLGRFCQRHNNIRVILNVGNREKVLDLIMDNATDIAIMGKPPEGAEIVAESFMENPLVVIASPAHPLAKKHRIPLKRLEQETFLLREQGSGTLAAMERFFAEHNIKLNTRMELGTNEAIKQAVQAGIGLGVVSLHTLELELETGRIKVLDVEGFPIARHWYVGHHQKKRLSTAAQAFKDFLLNEAAKLVKIKK